MRVNFNRFHSVICFVLSFFLITISGLAKADYIYTYTGQPFNVTSTMILPVGEGEWMTFENTFGSTITAAIRTSSLLTPGTGLADIISITMTGTPYEGVLSTLEYPGAPILDPAPPFDLTVGASFDIFSLDAEGLPSAWNISVDQYLFVGGRGHFIQMITSTTTDNINGYDEPYGGFSGSNQNTPGIWQMTWVSSVPENQTPGMVLLGLSIIGLIVRRSHSKYQSSTLAN
jgi:hypothetical protein